MPSWQTPLCRCRRERLSWLPSPCRDWRRICLTHAWKTSGNEDWCRGVLSLCGCDLISCPLFLSLHCPFLCAHLLFLPSPVLSTSISSSHSALPSTHSDLSPFLPPPSSMYDLSLFFSQSNLCVRAFIKGLQLLLPFPQAWRRYNCKYIHNCVCW